MYPYLILYFIKPFIADIILLTDVDEYFISKGIESIIDRTQFLQNYMGVIGTSSFGTFSDTEEYELAKEIFIAGRWKLLNRKESVVI